MRRCRECSIKKPLEAFGKCGWMCEECRSPKARAVRALDRYWGVSKTCWCIDCGRSFPALDTKALYCSPACRKTTWVARAKLAGTHHYVKGEFVRVAA